MTNAMILILTFFIFPFLDSHVPHAHSYVVYISQLIWFARVSRHLTDCSVYIVLTAKPLQHSIGFINFGMVFAKFIIDTMNRFLNTIPNLKHF